MGAVRTAREVVELYNLVVWNEQDLQLADELFADNVIRHGVGAAQTLTHAQAVQRVADMWQVCESLHFDLNIVVAGDDGEHVAIVYDSTVMADGGVTNVASIEVFRVVDGRITEVWNCGYQQGVWK
ncbi:MULTISPECIES: nuclear transport factor 2 family protein [unclassified Mycobacterium]|uniref:nuclear transport factor 2 family protein n=1 Tax=unclassified Mycobacterium TaxID=2642494 RepID=UPI000FA884B5|nr:MULTISPECIES: nuclear transport factor 2 family protein [unclassified Mycobacterium]MDP7705275.1 nuclear transport factor 2 family protein [Mycobacterium sp. TY815]MDP7723497.1 nuclear transport factor 2 family protein [Mycobacterium sp. TY814]RUP05225.1 MAG: nuclear transport factor 2 family protein [Mycobacterium sp.]